MSCSALRKTDHHHHAGDPCAVERDVPLDLLSRLRQLCLGFGAQTGVPCRLCVKPEHARFEAAAAEVLYQALRELLSVIRRHVRASLEVSSAIRDDGALALSVTSPGVPLAACLNDDRIRLWGVDQRLREIGAHLEVVVEGARLSVVLPGQAILVR
jgi:signal transduction histidine kinase